MTAASSTRVSAYDSYSLPGSNTTVGNTSYTLTYINNFYQNAAYAATLVRAFDSYYSMDGGTTWNPPTTQTPQLPPTSYAAKPGGDVPLYVNNTTTYAKTVSDVVTGSSLKSLVGTRRLFRLHQRRLQQCRSGYQQLCERLV